MSRDWLAVVFGQGGWVWWHRTLALVFLTMVGMLVYAWRDPQGPGGGAFLMFIAYFLAWVLLLFITTVDVLLWCAATQRGWGQRLLFVLLAWIAISLLWTLLFRATDPNYPERLIPGRILFGLHSTALYVANLWMLAVARA